MNKLTLIYTDKSNPQFYALCSQLNRELLYLLTGSIDTISTRATKTDNFTDVILACLDEEPVGCIALQPFSSKEAEIKRMYVVPQERRKSIGTQLLRKAEQIAAEKGYSGVVLETNVRLPIAGSLYNKEGFQRMESYGPYADVEDTLCMRKQLE